MTLASPPDLKQWIKDLPNKLTLSRIAAIPLILVVYHIDLVWVRIFTALLFLAAALTDIFDGWLARKYNLESAVGALLDPIADKMLTTSALVLLTGYDVIFTWITAVFLCRDIAVSGMRLIALEKDFRLDVNSFGKLKTGFQSAAIFCLIINHNVLEIPFKTAGWVFLWVALVLSLVSAFTYWQSFWDNYKIKR